MFPNIDIEQHRKITIPRLLQQMGHEEDTPSTWTTVELNAKQKVDIIIYHPRVSTEETRASLPTLLYVPGTGFTALEYPGWGGIICSHIAKKSDCQVVVLRHRLAPEDPFPAAITDVVSLSCYFIGNARKYKIDITHLSLGGYSSGGNIATAACALLTGQGFKIRSLYLISPMLDLTRSITGYRDYEECDNFPENLVQWMIYQYMALGNRTDPLASPVRLPPRFLPDRIHLFVGENDRFRGDTEDVYRKMQKTGKTVSRDIFPGGNHAGFWYNIRSVERVAGCAKISETPVPIYVSIIINNPENQDDNYTQMSFR